MQQMLLAGAPLHPPTLHQQQSQTSAMQPLNALSADINPSGNMNFIPHKNLMPKTTGSQAHLLSI